MSVPCAFMELGRFVGRTGFGHPSIHGVRGAGRAGKNASLRSLEVGDEIVHQSGASYHFPDATQIIANFEASHRNVRQLLPAFGRQHLPNGGCRSRYDR
jgi:hypothetical protein